MLIQQCEGVFGQVQWVGVSHTQSIGHTIWNLELSTILRTRKIYKREGHCDTNRTYSYAITLYSVVTPLEDLSSTYFILPFKGLRDSYSYNPLEPEPQWSLALTDIFLSSLSLKKSDGKQRISCSARILRAQTLKATQYSPEIVLSNSNRRQLKSLRVAKPRENTRLSWQKLWRKFSPDFSFTKINLSRKPEKVVQNPLGYLLTSW